MGAAQRSRRPAEYLPRAAGWDSPLRFPYHGCAAISGAYCRRRGMSDMRLIVAGAGGRMGRTLIHAIAASKGVTLAAAVEAVGSAVIGRDAGELAGLGKNGVTVAGDIEPLLGSADGLLDFTVPAATMAFAELAGRAGMAHVIGTTGLSGEHENLIAQ